MRWSTFWCRFTPPPRPANGIDRYGEIEAVRFNTDENFDQTESYVGKLVSRERFDHIATGPTRSTTERADLFQRRITEGRIRESHGDLHLGNIFFEDPPVIFDCIEFNERFRCGDVAVDLAFLAMDLDFNGRPDLARALRRTATWRPPGDAELLELLELLQVLPGLRARQDRLLHVGRPGARRHRKTQSSATSRGATSASPTTTQGASRNRRWSCCTGLMGSGKTSIARHLREQYGWHMLSTDAIRKQISGVGEATRVYVPYNEGLYSPEMNSRTYDEVCERAENLLLGGFDVVIDGAFKRQVGDGCR